MSGKENRYYDDDPLEQNDPLEQKIKKLEGELKRERARGQSLLFLAVLFFLASAFGWLLVWTSDSGSSKATGISPIDTMIMVQNETRRTLEIEIDRLKRRRPRYPRCTGAVDEALDQLEAQVVTRVGRDSSELAPVQPFTRPQFSGVDFPAPPSTAFR